MSSGSSQDLIGISLLSTVNGATFVVGFRLAMNIQPVTSCPVKLAIKVKTESGRDGLLYLRGPLLGGLVGSGSF